MLKNLIPWKKNKTDLNYHYKKGDILHDFHKQFNDLFDNFFSDFDKGFQFPSLWKDESDFFQVPEIDVHETEKEIKVEANLPGILEKDIKVNLDGDRLIIEAEKCEEKENKDKRCYISERKSGAFKRVIKLPEALIDKDKIKASLKSGVLKVDIPKAPDKQKCYKKIQITS